MNRGSLLGIAKPVRALGLCAVMLVVGTMLGVAATLPGIRKAESGLLKLAQAESGRATDRMLAQRENLGIVIRAIKDNPEAVAAFEAMMTSDASQEYRQMAAAGSIEAIMGLVLARRPYLNIVPMPTGSGLVEALRTESDADLYAKTGMHLPDAAAY